MNREDRVDDAGTAFIAAGEAETTTLDAGQYVLNAEGSCNGVPVDSAARRLWGVPVTVTTAIPAGTGYLLSNGVTQLVTDGALQAEGPVRSRTTSDATRFGSASRAGSIWL